jgi:hypothetical protein
MAAGQRSDVEGKNPKSEYRNPKQIRMGGKWGIMRKTADLLTLPENSGENVH